MSDTPRTDAVIAKTNAEHIAAGFPDFEHYYGLVAVLAQWSRQLEGELSRATASASVGTQDSTGAK